MMKATKDGLGIEEVTASEVAQAQMVGDVTKGVGVVTEIHKALQTPQLKKDK